ncbi:MAG TPA: hypothetical protein VFW62_12665 [bacterium]|nr:hypothetical protein [bacterium]
MSGSAKIIPIRAHGARALKGKTGEAHGDPWIHTLDLLMEDFGKKHRKELCVLCEPMQILGLHRDAVMVDLAESLFLAFFPSFESYVMEVREGLLQGLLDRRDRGNYGSWQAKLKELLVRQVATDLRDFIGDIEKHLRKFASVELEEERRAAIFTEAFSRLEKEWLWKST